MSMPYSYNNTERVRDRESEKQRERQLQWVNKFQTVHTKKKVVVKPMGK